MKKLIFILLIIGNLFADCNGKLFSINIGEKGIPLKSLLSDIATKCDLTIITKDDVAKKKLDSTITLVNIKKETIKNFLDDLFATQGCFVTISHNKVYISYYKTKTYKLNIISSNRTGTSSLSGSGGSSLGGGSGGDSSQTLDFSGSSSISDTYQFDVWGVIKDKINTILKNNQEEGGKVLAPVIDKNSGLVIVTGNRKQIMAVDRYMRDMKRRLMKQVYIDVKILSVTLSKSHQTGINWQNLNFSLNGNNKVTSSNLVGDNSVFKTSNFTMKAFLNLLARYGNVNSISNPQIVTLNNQKSIIQVGVRTYYSVNTIGDNNQTVTDWKPQFAGVSLDIIPRISDNNEITLYVYPSISSFRNTTNSQSVGTTTNNQTQPKDVKTNTLVSMVRLKNNQTLVLGGLIANDKSLQSNGVPILKEIPLVKYLFSYKESITHKNEIVFTITPHIIDLNKKATIKDYGFGVKKLPSLEDLNVK